MKVDDEVHCLFPLDPSDIGQDRSKLRGDLAARLAVADYGFCMKLVDIDVLSFSSKVIRSADKRFW